MTTVSLIWMDEKLIPRANDPSFMSEHMKENFFFTNFFVLAWIRVSFKTISGWQCLGSSVWEGVLEPILRRKDIIVSHSIKCSVVLIMQGILCQAKAKCDGLNGIIWSDFLINTIEICFHVCLGVLKWYFE